MKRLGTGGSLILQARVPRDLHDAFLEKVAEDETTISQVLRDLIKSYVDEVEALQKAWTQPLPSSHRPGV